MMLTEICAEIKNYFCADADKHFGTFTISGGSITAPPIDYLQDGQYFRIVGSKMNEGVYKWPCTTLTDEKAFKGAVWAMAVPPAFVSLCNEIEEFQNSDQAKPSVYISESFGGYSGTKSATQSGAPAGWQAVFASRLNQYRKVRV